MRKSACILRSRSSTRALPAKERAKACAEGLAVAARSDVCLRLVKQRLDAGELLRQALGAVERVARILQQSGGRRGWAQARCELILYIYMRELYQSADYNSQCGCVLTVKRKG